MTTYGNAGERKGDVMVLLLVLATVMALLAVEAIKFYRQREQAKALAVGGGVYFYPGHTWASFQPTGLVKVGFDKFIRSIAGKFDTIILPSDGRLIKQGQLLATITRKGKDIHILSPIDGVVVAANHKISDEKAFKSDHILVLRPTRIDRNMFMMKDRNEAAIWLNAEFARFRDFICERMGANEAGLAMADGGSHIDDIITHMDKETLNSFNKEFLLN